MTEFFDLYRRLQKLLEMKKAILSSPSVSPSSISISSLSSLSESSSKRLQLKGDMLLEIQKGRRDLNLDIIVRHPNGEAATLENTSFIKLYRLYQDYIQVSLSLSHTHTHFLSFFLDSYSFFLSLLFVYFWGMNLIIFEEIGSTKRCGAAEVPTESRDVTFNIAIIIVTTSNCHVIFYAFSKS